jgi:hypothetical protein
LHDHSAVTSTDGAHTHTASFTISSVADNLPPYDSLTYIIKTGGLTSGVVSSGLTVLYNPAGSVPGGWNPAANMDGVFLAGYKSGDTDFGSYGNKTAEPGGKWGTVHKHNVAASLIAGVGPADGGPHSHGSSGSPEDTDGPSTVVVMPTGPTSVASNDHVHAMYTSDDGAHQHDATGETITGDHEPAYTGVLAITKI